MTYASYDLKNPRYSAERPLVRSVVGFVSEKLGRLFAARRARREIAKLARSHDGLLEDIGLTRSDVDWALMRHWSEDPSEALAARLQCRKAATRWARSYQAN